MRHDNKSKKNDVINGKQVANTMRRELRINVTNWEDQLFWMTQPAAVPSCCCSCFFGWCLLKCKTPTHTQNFMLSYISNYGKVMHRFPTSGSENHVFTQRMSLDFHVLFCHKNLRNYNASCFKRLNKLIFYFFWIS